MTTATIDRPMTTTATTEDVIKIAQEHLDKEARNRQQPNLQPRDLCPMQKAEMVQEIRASFGL